MHNYKISVLRIVYLREIALGPAELCNSFGYFKHYLLLRAVRTTSPTARTTLSR